MIKYHSTKQHIAIGTAQLGQKYGITNKAGQIDLSEGKQILQFASESGVDTLDTAISYGDSESKLGKIGVKDWDVISKIPSIPYEVGDIQGWMIDNVLASLQRLDIKKYKCLLLHSPRQLTGIQGEKIYKTLTTIKKNGLCDQIGISIYHPGELEIYFKNYRFDLIQAPFSIFDRRISNSGWLEKLYREDVEIHVRSIFLQGLLLLKPTALPQQFRKWHYLWDKWEAWLLENKLTSLEACLRFVSSFPEINKIIIGIDSIKQLKEILLIENNKLIVPDSLSCEDIDLIDPSRWIKI